MLMNETIRKNGKVNNHQVPIIALERARSSERKDQKYIEHTCYNTPGDNKTGKYVIQVPIYDSGHPEEWINFVELVNKCIIGQNITTGPQMYQLAVRVLQGDAKAQFEAQTGHFGSQTAGNFKSVMAAMTVHVFPRYALRDQKRYLTRYLEKPLKMKVRKFVTRLTQLNHYLDSFPPDSPGQQVEKLPDHEVKEILFYAMPKSWQKSMTVQGYNYMDDKETVQSMADFFELRCENLEVKPEKKSKDKKASSKKKKSSVQFQDDSEEESSEDEKPRSNRLYCLYHGRCGHTSDKCEELKKLIRQAKKNKFPKKAKGKRSTSYNKHEVNALLDKKLKKVFKSKKKKKHQEMNEFENLEVSDGEKSASSSSSSSSSSNSE